VQRIFELAWRARRLTESLQKGWPTLNRARMVAVT
jgi:hypothetical protein